MSTIDAMNRGIQGIQRGMEGAARNAGRIARSGENGPPVKEMVALKENQHLVESSAKVVRAADEMIGTLLDIEA